MRALLLLLFANVLSADVVSEALLAHKQGRETEALRGYLAALNDDASGKLSPAARSTICANAASIEAKKGDETAAEDHLRCAVEAAPSAFSLANLGGFLLGKDRYQESEEVCRAALKIDSTHVAATRYLAESLALLGITTEERSFLTLLPLERIAAALDLKATVLSRRPAVWRVHNFLEPAECRAILKSDMRWREAQTTTTPDVKVRWRKGEVASLNIVAVDSAIVAKLSDLLLVSPESIIQGLEPAQLARYGPADYFHLHFDATPATPLRHLSVLIYLDDDDDGATHFPFAALQDDDNVAGLSPHEAIRLAQENRADAGLFVKPSEGDAIVFFNTDKRANLDLFSLHAGLPVQTRKHVANLWLRLG